MAADPFIGALCLVQIIAALVLAIKSAIAKRRLSAIGAVVGIGLGFLPPFLYQGPAVWKPWFVIGVASTVVLFATYAFERRWKQLILVTLVILLPVGVHKAFRELSSTETTPTLGLLYDMTALFAPIMCALAVREVFRLLHHLNFEARSA